MSESHPEAAQADQRIGRYVLFDEIAAGGMATVHLGKLKGPVGFSRTVAIKRLHPEYARDPQFCTMFLDEARLASRVRHPNVVPTLDVVTTEGQLYLVMEYVQGVSLASLLDTTSAAGKRVPPNIVASIVSGALMGLHAAHEAQDEDGENLGIVHRDVSPSNVLVGTDGMPRVLDFGVAKAAGRMHNTRGNVLKGTLGYIAPEQFNKENIDRRADIYSAAVMLWEALCGKPLFEGETEYAVIAKALFGNVSPPSTVDPELAPFDHVVMKGLDREPDNRWDTAREMALAIENCAGVASNAAVASWLEHVAGETLAERAHVLARVEGGKGRRVSEIRAAMLDALDLEEELTSTDTLGDEPDPISDHTAAADMTGSQALLVQTSPKKSSGLRVALGIAAIAIVAGAAVLWMQTQTAAPLSTGQVIDPVDPEGGSSADTVAAAAPAPDAVRDPAPDTSASVDTSPSPDSPPTGSASAGGAAAGGAAAEGAPSASASAPRWQRPPGWPPRNTAPKTGPKPSSGGKKPWERDRFGQ